MAINKFLRGRKEIIIDLIIILILGTLSISWFRGNNLIVGGDFGMPLDWVKYLKNMFWVWVEDYSFGRTDYRNLASLVPYALTGGLLQSLGFSLVLIEKIFFYTWFAGAGLSMYFLGWTLGMKRIGRIVSSIFYMLNPFSLVIIWLVSHGLIQMPYAFAPLILGLFIYGLTKKKGLGFILLFCLAWLLLTGSAYANPRSAIIHWVPIIFYYFYYLVFYKDQRKTAIRFGLLLAISWLLLNIYWIFPYAANMVESNADSHSPFLLPDIEELKLTSVNLFEAIRMLGYWSMKSGYKGEPYYPYWQYYTSPWIISISWLIPVLVLFGLFNQDVKKGKMKYFYLAIIFFGLLGINGANPPVGRLILLVYKILPPLVLLARFNFLFFGLPTYLIFSVLVGYGVLSVYDFLKKRIGTWSLAFPIATAILLNIVLVWPFWNREVIRSQGKLMPGERVKIPEYWWEAKQWLARQSDFFRILPLPMSKTYNTAYYWGEGYSGGDLIRWIVPQPVLNVNTGETFKTPMIIGEAIAAGSQTKNISNLLGFLSTKYLLIRNDTRWEFLKWHDSSFNHLPENIKPFLEKQENLSLDKKIGELEFYRIADDLVLPQVYSPSSLIVIKGDQESLLDLSSFLSPDKRVAFIFADESVSAEPNYLWQLPVLSGQNEIGDLTQVDYQFAIAKEGVFEILIRNEDFLDDYTSSGDIGFSINGGEVKKSVLIIRDDNLFSLGEEKLPAGEVKITLFLPTPLNLIYQDFPLPLKLVSGSKGMISLAVNKFKLGGEYQISLNAKNVQGLPPFVVIWQNFIDSSTPIFDQTPSRFFLSELKTSFSSAELPSTKDWRKYKFPFKPHPLAKYFGISLVSRSSSLGITENMFDEISVQRIFNNPLILRNRSVEKKLTVPQVTFKKINPTKYNVSVKGASQPFWLVFSEAFHPKWTISVDGEHAMINGFANGWYIKKTGDFETEIYFKPQNDLYFGVGVSALFLFGSVMYLIVGKLKSFQ